MFAGDIIIYVENIKEPTHTKKPPGTNKQSIHESQLLSHMLAMKSQNLKFKTQYHLIKR